MGIDINLFRKEKGGDPEKVRVSEQRRHPENPKAGDIVDEIIKVDKEWRKKQFETENLKKEQGTIQKEIGSRKKASKGKDACTDLIEAKTKYDKQILESKKISDSCKNNLDNLLSNIGNIVHDSVPISNNEHDNEVVRTWGTIKDLKITNKPGFCNHHKVLAMISGYDPKRGQKVAGHRGYFLKGYGALLNMALVHYGMKFLFEKGYTPIQTPFFMKRELMAETAQLSDFADQLYKIESGENTDKKDDLFMIATSEQPISGYFRGEWIEQEQLPIRFGGMSTCFRKEAGAHGKDVWGIFRVHQFEKIEQFTVVEADKSWDEHNKMCQISEEFLQTLGLPYRVVNIVSGELNDAAAKKYDIEAWFPGYEDYRELMSISNCTDFQSRGLGVRIRSKKTQKTDKSREKEFVHMLNGTLCATERTLCCILENYQEEEGVRVPEPLIPYLGTDFIKYTEAVPKDKDLKTDSKKKK